jgi:hypothetical protein
VESPVIRTRVPEPLRDRVLQAASTLGVSPSVFMRTALADRVTAVETIHHAALKVQAHEAAERARAEGDTRLARILDYLLLRLDVADALLGVA